MKKGAENCLSQTPCHTDLTYTGDGLIITQAAPSFKEEKHMKKIRFYRTCPLCGAHLDHGERCDCEKGGAQE